MDMPITIARELFLQDVASIINKHKELELPAFVMTEVLERAVSQLKNLETQELQRDLAMQQKKSADGADKTNAMSATHLTSEEKAQ